MKTEFPGSNPMKSNNFIIQIILQVWYETVIKSVNVKACVNTFFS